VVVGKIVDTYGLKGELKVEPYLEAKHWKKLKRVFLKRKGGPYVPFEVERVRPHGKDKLLLKFVGYDHLSSVEGFRSAHIYLPKEELPKRGKDQYYYFELEGLEVFTEGGKRLGKITGVLSHKPYDLLEIDQGKTYIPFVKALVKEVRLKEGKLLVSHILEEL
ncbi:MAG: 16S rRNA processing protein RimM, partial [Aquificota bacterium]